MKTKRQYCTRKAVFENEKRRLYTKRDLFKSGLYVYHVKDAAVKAFDKVMLAMVLGKIHD